MCPGSSTLARVCAAINTPTSGVFSTCSASIPAPHTALGVSLLPAGSVAGAGMETTTKGDGKCPKWWGKAGQAEIGVNVVVLDILSLPDPGWALQPLTLCTHRAGGAEQVWGPFCSRTHKMGGRRCGREEEREESSGCNTKPSSLFPDLFI